MSARQRRVSGRKAPSKTKSEPRPREAATSRAAGGRTGAHTGAIVVCVVALAASITGIANAFTQDDLSIIVESTRLHGLGGLGDILTLPYWPPPAAPDLYRPVASVLMALQYMVGAGAPMVFRVVSYALYAAASIGVYQLARRLMPEFVAMGVAVLFAASTARAVSVWLPLADLVVSHEVEYGDAVSSAPNAAPSR